MKQHSKEYILELAAKSNDSREICEKLYPEYFEYQIETKEIDSLISFEFKGQKGEIALRFKGNLHFKSFFLSRNFNWKIEVDDCGVQCLIPMVKE